MSLLANFLFVFVGGPLMALGIAWCVGRGPEALAAARERRRDRRLLRDWLGR